MSRLQLFLFLHLIFHGLTIDLYLIRLLIPILKHLPLRTTSILHHSISLRLLISQHSRLRQVTRTPNPRTPHHPLILHIQTYILCDLQHVAHRAFAEVDE